MKSRMFAFGLFLFVAVVLGVRPAYGQAPNFDVLDPGVPHPCSDISIAQDPRCDDRKTALINKVEAALDRTGPIGNLPTVSEIREYCALDRLGRTATDRTACEAEIKHDIQAKQGLLSDDPRSVSQAKNIELAKKIRGTNDDIALVAGALDKQLEDYFNQLSVEPAEIVKVRENAALYKRAAQLRRFAEMLDGFSKLLKQQAKDLEKLAK